ncbi:flagellar export protein FliJ [Noviherbaspirillum autotrophicum]|uniref:Flagellar FliJ protein n=1 Tax=Noviherbaspirillum autotrophicum TaxID=709839 RepID=A0A0C2BPZ0_9BURK|nr:flagellar export protein FliJ [Noviherbaspirillum autotrophicum]KIF82149.1 flagellar biosynthesis protein FliJ [Noviherbaspirillum autotrophicum]
MATPSALDTLIELATQQTDEAAKRLGRAIRNSEDAEKKLQLLLQYRDDYMARFQTTLQAGLSASSYRNFQHFIDKLDEAIKGQQRVIQDAQGRVTRERGAWQDSERKRISYDTLATRAEKVRQLKESRRDQKQTDEFAARALFNKR